MHHNLILQVPVHVVLYFKFRYVRCEKAKVSKMDGKTLVTLQFRPTVVSCKMVNLLMWLMEMMKLLSSESLTMPRFEMRKIKSLQL